MTLSTIETNVRFTPSLRRSTLTAVFPDRTEARHVINDLMAFGLRSDQISVAMRDRRAQDKLIADTGLHASEGAADGTANEQTQGGLRGFFDSLRSNVFPASPPPATAAPGGMIGAFINMRMPEGVARRQESGYREGSVLVSAQVFEDVGEAQRIMQGHGGASIRFGEHAPLV